MATNKKKDYAEARDHHQELTNRLIETMEASEATNWEKPWFTCCELPFNPVTGTRYKGVNAVSLMTAGFNEPRFLTFKGVQELSAKEGIPMHVKKGAKGFPVFKAMQVTYADQAQGQDEENAKGDTRTFWKMVYAGTVFNASQIEGMTPYVVRERTFEPHEELDTLSKALQARTGLEIVHSEQGRAYYSPSSHKVHMPNVELFKDKNAYGDTLLHELGHSTGPELKRDLSGMFGSASYAKEEFVAELTSIFMSAALAIPHSAQSHENHAAYMKSWLAALKGDKNYIFQAASQASKATEFQIEHMKAYKLDMALNKAQVSERKQEVGMTM